MLIASASDGLAPHWDIIKSILKDGTSFPLDPIDKVEFHKDSQFNVSHGNHKSTEKKIATSRKLIKGKDHQGLSLPLRIDCHSKFDGISISPYGMIT
jgi:hypothetical protein